MKNETLSIRFPAEWYPQSAVILTWPHKKTDWSPILREVITCYISIVREIIRREKVIIVCPSIADVKCALGNDTDYSQVLFREILSNDTWTRDHGPFSVFINDHPSVLDCTFNGWGLKYQADLDNQITKKLYQSGIFLPDTKYYSINIVLEGGSIESDGLSTILTTSQCLFAPNRNNFLNIKEAEDYIKKLFGMQRVLWLNHGYLVGDDTDSHIDTLARFCNSETIAYVRCTDDNDEHFEELSLMEYELQNFCTEQGKPYCLIPLPMVEAIYANGNRLPATYANFLIINGAVLMPIYHVTQDEIARKALQEVFTDREVIGVDCLPLIQQHGSLHCVTMQLPVGFIAL